MGSVELVLQTQSRWRESIGIRNRGLTYAEVDARFDAKASMALMIPIALCRSRLPLPRPIMALHQATASSGETRRRSDSDLAPSAIALLRS